MDVLALSGVFVGTGLIVLGFALARNGLHI